ncbi:MAG: SigB/SigF/SigG family RNA polymerase sigma factor [Solirubrobacteraceae bacterium]
MTGRGRDGREIEALFVTLRAGGSEAVRTTLIERHLPLARRLASRYRYTPQPLEDLVQVASLALVKAVDAFDPARGVAFSTFAVPTIVGELKRHMRETAWVVRVPRALQERTLAVERAERSLSARLGTAPTAAELASETGFSTEEVLEALGARVAHDAVSLDAPTGGSDDDAASAIGARLAASDSGLDDAERRVFLSRALRELADRERTILRLRFIDGLTQTEIAERVGLSQMHVSRLLRSTLATLRMRLS